MKIRHGIALVICIVVSLMIMRGYTQEQYLNVIYACEMLGGILEEWESPGKYSPINMFDDDIRTCFAEGNDEDQFTLYLQLEIPITCDEVQVLGGVALNDDLYIKNNRPKELTIWLYETYEARLKDKEALEKEVILEDKREYQSIRFDKPYTFEMFSVQVLETYKGTQYNDTCITELKFFNKGKEIKAKDIDKMKKHYIKVVGERLRGFLKPGLYDVSEGLCEAIIDSKGYIKFRNFDSVYSKYYKDATILLTRIFEKDSRLYVEYNGKVYMTKYILRFYPEQFHRGFTAYLSVYNIGGIEKNNLSFMKRK